MANINKIKKYRLESEVLALRRAGHNYDEIKDILIKNHPDLTEIQNLSVMSLSRFFSQYKTETALEKKEHGEDPTLELRAIFRDKMYELDEQTAEIYRMMRRALKKVVKEQDDYKTIKAAKDTLSSIEQIRRNWSTFIQWSINEYKPIEEASEITKQEIMDLLIEISRELCPECRAKVVEIITREKED